MRLSILFTCLAISNGIFAGELCTKFKPELKERRNESQFEEVSFNKALSGLQGYSASSGIDPWPYMVVIEGYLLKQDALEEVSSSQPGPAVNAFCEFIVQQGVNRG